MCITICEKLILLCFFILGDFAYLQVLAKLVFVLPNMAEV